MCNDAGRFSEGAWLVKIITELKSITERELVAFEGMVGNNFVAELRFRSVSLYKNQSTTRHLKNNINELKHFPFRICYWNQMIKNFVQVDGTCLALANRNISTFSWIVMQE